MFRQKLLFTDELFTAKVGIQLSCNSHVRLVDQAAGLIAFSYLDGILIREFRRDLDCFLNMKSNENKKFK